MGLWYHMHLVFKSLCRKNLNDGSDCFFFFFWGKPPQHLGQTDHLECCTMLSESLLFWMHVLGYQFILIQSFIARYRLIWLSLMCLTSVSTFFSISGNGLWVSKSGRLPTSWPQCALYLGTVTSRISPFSVDRSLARRVAMNPNLVEPGVLRLTSTVLGLILPLPPLLHCYICLFPLGIVFYHFSLPFYQPLPHSWLW